VIVGNRSSLAAELDSPDALANRLSQILREDKLESVEQLLATPVSALAVRNVLSFTLKKMDRSTLVVLAIPADDDQAVARAKSELTNRGDTFTPQKYRQDKNAMTLLAMHSSYSPQPIGDLLIMDKSRAFQLSYGKVNARYLISLRENKTPAEASK
jgi:hypothetical protein